MFCMLIPNYFLHSLNDWHNEFNIQIKNLMINWWIYSNYSIWHGIFLIQTQLRKKLNHHRLNSLSCTFLGKSLICSIISFEVLFLSMSLVLLDIVYGSFRCFPIIRWDQTFIYKKHICSNIYYFYEKRGNFTIFRKQSYFFQIKLKIKTNSVLLYFSHQITWNAAKGKVHFFYI